jgi:hypothetical protein
MPDIDQAASPPLPVRSPEIFCAFQDEILRPALGARMGSQSGGQLRWAMIGRCIQQKNMGSMSAKMVKIALLSSAIALSKASVSI